MVAGVQGYDRAIERFVESSQQLNFLETNRDFLPFLPKAPARVLDLGAGAGQNAAALARLGFQVTAIEPMPEFLQAAQAAYTGLAIDWRQDSLPLLDSLVGGEASFRFMLVDGVWHHLSEAERRAAFERLAPLLVSGGRLALSLRNGPPGLGLKVHPTDVDRTVNAAKELGLRCILRIEDQPSIFKHKPEVRWARVVLEK
ncbi:class I SAM-dependent methyltransferase [Cerasicoccus frondis]|uniref:class I SAM-dependent methyltransferase n=1 Tax=Cerasicoccus frondis TaxID=490090 RepID=UPI0028529EAC|nr:methyltransferase domain-containing protein [Cerasicoccus frondis]